MEFPDHLEFRDEGETDEQGNILFKEEKGEKLMVSEETQTIIKTGTQTRRRLPRYHEAWPECHLFRTISIYDFPSMKDKEESTLTFKTPALMDDTEVNGIIEFVHCPKGILHSPGG